VISRRYRRGGVSWVVPVACGAVRVALLRHGADFVVAHREAGQTVMVACGAGTSRSTSFAIAALKEAESYTQREAAHVVRRAHPGGMPHVALWESLCAYYAEPS
jgi:protein-tyrosine phosphatase